MRPGAVEIGIAGTGAIGLACAAWLTHGGHAVTVWSPGGHGAAALRDSPLHSSGVLQAETEIAVAARPAALARGAKVLLIAVPLNGHRAVMDALLPHLASGQTIIVSSMGSLSSLYLFERARRAGIDITVASMGSTVLTARREGAAGVHLMTRRTELGLSALPRGRTDAALALCADLFGDVFVPDANCLASALANINPVAHGALALFNWTRIERAEHWPQYHYMTPQVAAVIERLDAERLALARAFGLSVRTIAQHFAKSFGTSCDTVADIAAELHAKRGGPPGPTDTGTRFVFEDMPYGLAFNSALGRIAGVPTPAADTIVQACSLVAGQELAARNDLIAPLGIASENVAGLLERVNVDV
ncbi:MAG: NAD/NADP octopine/nopaline dehydrogenase family protein [Ramlibacter sp.]|nr:NAD/NADP octopine/nopaline dehydrogenase family protein [Ramlibacter sp.]